jgi:adenylate cyclase class 2
MADETLEVEMKFPLRAAERDAAAGMEQSLAQLGAVWRGTIEQIDEYLAHPLRDFAQTDEAFRIRSVGEANCLTYKGPKLDAETKTRREIEVSFAEGPSEREEMRQMLIALGFRPVACVRKQRREGSVQWQHWEVELALDEVDGAGRFLELEVCTSANKMPAAKQVILELAAKLDLGPTERRSYLELVLAASR